MKTEPLTKFTPEQKANAVKMYLETSLSAREVARMAGCSIISLRRWVREYRESQGDANAGNLRPA